MRILCKLNSLSRFFLFQFLPKETSMTSKSTFRVNIYSSLQENTYEYEKYLFYTNICHNFFLQIIFFCFDSLKIYTFCTSAWPLVVCWCLAILPSGPLWLDTSLQADIEGGCTCYFPLNNVSIHFRHNL